MPLSVDPDKIPKLCNFCCKQTALRLILEKNSLLAEEITIFLAVKKWIEVNNPDKPTTSKILKLVRVPLISPKVCYH